MQPRVVAEVLQISIRVLTEPDFGHLLYGGHCGCISRAKSILAMKTCCLFRYFDADNHFGQITVLQMEMDPCMKALLPEGIYVSRFSSPLYGNKPHDPKHMQLSNPDSNNSTRYQICNFPGPLSPAGRRPADWQTCSRSECAVQGSYAGTQRSIPA